MCDRVPPEWTATDLAAVLVSIRNGTTVEQTDQVTPFPVTRIETISEGEINRSRVRYLRSPLAGYEMQAGDILYSHINSLAHIGKIAHFDGSAPLYHGMNLMLLRPDSTRVLSRLLAAILDTPEARSHARREAKPAINQASLGQGQIQSLVIKLPPLPEQRRIAEVLDTADEAIRRSEALLAKLEQVKAGLLHDLLTRGLDEAGRLRDPEAHPEQFQDSPLGRIPREWEVAQVQELGQLITGNTPATSRSDYYGGDIPFVTPGDLGRLRCIHDSASSLTIAGSGVARMVPIGAVLITCIGVLGKVGLAARPLAVNQQINCLVPSPHLDSSYAYWACLRLKPQLDTVAGLQVVPIVNKGLLGKTTLPLPPLPEQRRIAAILDAHDARLRAERAQLDKLRQIKKGLMHDLLTGKVRVQVHQEARHP